MNNRESGPFCGVVGDTPAMGHNYATSWDTLHEQVNSSLSKCKLEYTKFRGMSAAIESNGTATSGSGSAVIATTVWNPTSKRDVTKNKIENKCLIYAEMANRKPTALPSTFQRAPSAKKPESEWGISPKRIGTFEKGEDEDDNYEGGKNGSDAPKKVIIVSTPSSVNLPRPLVSPSVIQSENQKRNSSSLQSAVTAVTKDISGGDQHLGIASDAPAPSMSTGSVSSARQTGSAVAIGTNYCCRCGEAISAKELLPVSDADMALLLTFHARCFRCQFCDLELTPSDADRRQLASDGRVYCSGHGPPPLDRGNVAVVRQGKAKASNSTTFNGQIRGPHAGKVAHFDSSALSIQAALKAPRSSPKPSHSIPPHDVVKSDVIGLRYF